MMIFEAGQNQGARKLQGSPGSIVVYEIVVEDARQNSALFRSPEEGRVSDVICKSGDRETITILRPAAYHRFLRLPDLCDQSDRRDSEELSNGPGVSACFPDLKTIRAAPNTRFMSLSSKDSNAKPRMPGGQAARFCQTQLVVDTEGN